MYNCYNMCPNLGYWTKYPKNTHYVFTLHYVVTALITGETAPTNPDEALYDFNKKQFVARPDEGELSNPSPGGRILDEEVGHDSLRDGLPPRAESV